jgi:HSP20 family molecular chaperone IbpA
MTSKKNDEDKTEERLKEIEEKIKKLEEAQGTSPDKDASGGAAGGILRSIGNVIPGLGGLVGNVSKSPAFLEKLEEINEELDRRLRETPLKRVEPQVSGGVSSRPMGMPPGARDRSSSATPKRRAKAKRKRPEQRLAGEPPDEISADVFDEGDNIVVIAELPGVEEKDLEVKAQGQTLSIVVSAEGGKREQDVELPCAVQGEPQRSLNKGILRIQIEKAGTDD